MAPTEDEEFASYPKVKIWNNCDNLFENCEVCSHTKLENVFGLFSNFRSFETNKLVVSDIKYCDETISCDFFESNILENTEVKQVEVAVEVFNAIVNALKNACENPHFIWGW